MYNLIIIIINNYELHNCTSTTPWWVDIIVKLVERMGNSPHPASYWTLLNYLVFYSIFFP